MNLKVLRKYVMTVRQLEILLLLGKGKMKSRDVAINLEMSRPALCRGFDALCIDGLMFRERDEDDRRDTWGILTDKGMELVRDLIV